MSIARIGSLPSYLQGVALDLRLGEEATVDNTGTMHYSSHGYHGDLYYIRRISESEVEIQKLHTDELE
jgi:alpha-ketoglutarate-dependent taurine dioxygenase